MHPTIRQSHFLDGATPGMRNPRIYPSEEAMYIQPDIEVAEVGDGSQVTETKRSICQRLDKDMTTGVTGWLRANKSTILTVLAVYGGFKLLRRK
jgi:hypothetical protein